MIHNRLHSLFYIILTIFSILLLSGCGSTSTVSLTEASGQPVIDGSLSDWQSGQTRIESEDDINYYSKYDEDHLYLFIEITGPYKDRAIRQSGLIIYLNDHEEERKQTGIGYPAGAFNLLRENPAAFDNFLRESDWLTNPSNRETLENLENEIFDRIMIVERPDGRNPEYGFVEPSLIEVDGMEISADTQSRYISIEMKIPRHGNSLYNFTGNTVWLGLAIETPPFRINDDNEYSATSDRQRDIYGNRRQARPSRQNISRSLGEYEKWFRLELN